MSLSYPIPVLSNELTLGFPIITFYFMKMKTSFVSVYLLYITYFKIEAKQKSNQLIIVSNPQTKIIVNHAFWKYG